jgi:AraC-like DNA-binding protein
MGVTLDYLSCLLASRVHVTDVGWLECQSGYEMPEHLVAAPKLLLVASGAIVYRLEERDYPLAAGTMFFRGAWTRSSWRVPAGAAATSVGYCEFLVDAQQPGPVMPVSLDRRQRRVELETLTRLTAAWRAPHAGSALVLEGEVKAILARFLTTARAVEPVGEPGNNPSNADLLVADAIRWLNHNFAKPDVMARLSHAGLSPNHFRTRFRRSANMSPREYVTMLRMRAARYQLHRSASPVKQIARAVGYKDPLYFSKLYHQFWARWPSEDRMLPSNHSAVTTPAPTPPPGAS